MPGEPGQGRRAVLIPGIPLFLIPKVIQEQIQRERAGIGQIHVVRCPFNSFTISVVRTAGRSKGPLTGRRYVADGMRDVQAFLAADWTPYGGR